MRARRAPAALAAILAAAIGAAAMPAHADDTTATTVAPAPVAPAPTPPASHAAVRARSDRRRLAHAIAITGFGAVYLVSEFGVKDRLARVVCGWCAPTGLDEAVRDAWRWSDTGLANTLSNLTGYVAPPFATIGVLFLSTWSERSARRWFDDAAPVLEAAMSVGILNQLSKFAVGRSRPFVRFGEPGRPAELDDNTSFFSGHTALAFAQVVAAGVIAHRRGYRLEPLIWAGGMTLAAATGYLRIAADRHYFTDVLAGAAIGTAFGLVVPFIFHADVLGKNLKLTPTPNGVALTGVL